MRPLLFLLALLPALVAPACTQPPAPRPTPSAPATPAVPTARADFLKFIDRPRVPLAPQEQPTRAAAGLLAWHFTYASDAANRVPGILLKSADSHGRRPVVIALHGTGGSKSDELPLLRQLAAKGFIAVAIDGRYHGERAGTQGPKAYDDAIVAAWQGSHEHPLYFDTVWDVMRLIDYLQTRPDIDPARIGLYGVSKGGIETYLAAAMDPRIAVAIPCIAVQSFHWALQNNDWQGRIGTFQSAFDRILAQAGVPRADTPFVASFYAKVIPGIDGEWDGPTLLPLIAPRPLMTINGDSDIRTPLPGLKLCTDAALAAYQAAGAPDHFLVRIQPNTGHQVRPDSQSAAIDWFTRWLNPSQ